MKFKAGDRVHVTKLERKEVDFYATLTNFYFDSCTKTADLVNCSNPSFEGESVYLPGDEYFGAEEQDYYTLATDEEDTEEPEVQHVNDKFSFARSKSYDIQEYIQEGNNLNMKEGCAMPTIKTKKEMNLPQLIEWAGKNKVTNQIFRADKQLMNIQFDEDGDFKTYGFTGNDTTFTVEIEEEITGDTVLPKLVTRTVKGHYGLFIKESINNLKQINFTDVEAFYVPNDDLTMTLIWTKDKGLVE